MAGKLELRGWRVKRRLPALAGNVVFSEMAFDVVLVIGMGSIDPALKDRAGHLCPLAGAAANTENLP